MVTAAFEAAPLTGDSDVRLIASVNGNRPSRHIFNLNDKKWRYATFFCEDGNSPVKLRFEAAAAAQRPLFSGIKIYVGTAGETVCHENLSGPSFEVTGLEPEHTYYLQLKAECNNGYESQYSNGILVTLPKDGPGAAPMIGGDESGETAVYSITGVEIPANALTPGIYIMKSGSKTSKFVVK